MTNRIRFILAAPMLVVLFALGVTEVVRSAWRVDPLAPAGVLVAPDNLRPAAMSNEWPDATVFLYRHGSDGNEGGNASRAGVRLVATVARAGGQCQVARSTADGLLYAWSMGEPEEGGADRPGSQAGLGGKLEGRLYLTFRLSPELGFGPLQVQSTTFVLAPTRRFAAIDLEGIRSVGRYELDSANRERLVRLLDGRMPVYLADVGSQAEQYNRLHAELEAGGWPAGPLVAWRTRVDGRDVDKAKVAGRLARVLGKNLDLAVLADIADNRSAFREAGKADVIRDWRGQRGQPVGN